MNDVRCPKCGSNQYSANKKGFNLGKAVVGELIAGPIGAVIAGTKGSNEIIITCLSCGNQYSPGDFALVVNKFKHYDAAELLELEEEDMNNATALNKLIKNARESMWIGNSDIKKVEDLYSALCSCREDCYRIMKAYKAKFGLEVIEDLKSLSDNYNTIVRFVAPFIEFEIVEGKYPHDYRID